MIVLR
jgi:hypothetical protein